MNVWQAAQYGSVEKVRKLVQETPALLNRLDDKQASPLHWAAINGHVKVVRWLIDAGAEIDVAGGEQRSSPLHWAIGKGHYKVAVFLMSAGANVALRDVHGYSLVHSAAQNGKIFSLMLLWALNFDMDAVDKSGKTPLAWAAIQDYADAAAFLCTRDADVERADADGMTPLLWAVAQQSQRVAALLVDRLARAAHRPAAGVDCVEFAYARGLVWFLELLYERRLVDVCPVRGATHIERLRIWFERHVAAKHAACVTLAFGVLPALFFLLASGPLWATLPIAVLIAAFCVKVVFKRVLFARNLSYESNPIFTLCFQATSLMTVLLKIFVWRLHRPLLGAVFWLLLAACTVLFVRLAYVADPGYVKLPTSEKQVKAVRKKAFLF